MNILFPKAQLMTHKDPQFTQILFKQLESAEQRAPQKRSPSRLVADQLKLSYFSYSIVFIRPEKKKKYYAISCAQILPRFTPQVPFIKKESFIFFRPTSPPRALLPSFAPPFQSTVMMARGAITTELTNHRLCSLLLLLLQSVPAQSILK